MGGVKRFVGRGKKGGQYKMGCGRGEVMKTKYSSHDTNKSVERKEGKGEGTTMKLKDGRLFGSAEPSRGSRAIIWW